MIPKSLTSVSLADGVRINIFGVLDEHFDYESIVTSFQEHTVLDLKGIKRISSIGVSQWWKSLRSSPARTITFVNCPPCVMSQFNLIRNFDCGGTLVSFYLPYLCKDCGREHNVLYDRRYHPVLDLSSIDRPITCSHCGGTAEFDDMPEVYLEYVMRVGAPGPLADVVSDLIDAS
jgi:hypothetical protein